jgi:uncharacterized protein (TIGR03437 family)
MRFALFLTASTLGVAAEYSTYIGDQYPRTVASMTTDASGNTYVVGNRSTSSGPLSLELTLELVAVNNAISPFYYSPFPDDVFITKLDPSGKVLFTNVFAGKGYDSAASVAVDPSGNIYIAGFTTSVDFPVSNALQPQPAPNGAGFIVKLSPDGRTILYSTYFGGVEGSTAIRAVTTDASGNLYLSGSTTSSDFPHTTGLPLASSRSKTPAVFIASISAAGDKVLFSGTMTGTQCGSRVNPCGPNFFATQGLGIALDQAGNVYFGGNANVVDLPTTAGAFLHTGYGAFVGKINAGGTGLAYLTYLDSPASGMTLLYSLAVDAAGNAYLAGSTSNAKFPATSGALQTTLAGANNAFVAKLKPDGSALVWATYLGGTGSELAEWIAVDAAGNAWVCGTTTSPAFANGQGWSQGGDFLVELNPIGTALIYSARYPFGAVDQAVALDKSLLIHTAGFNGIVSAIASTGSPASRTFGVVNAAAGSLSGRIAPAEVISIFGPGIGPATAAAVTPVNGFYPKTFAGVQVSINGKNMPLLYLSANQINAVVPMGLATSLGATIRVTNGTTVYPDYPVWIDDSTPGAFPGVLNQDGTINSQTNPARDGSTVTIYATGWQSDFSPLADGQVATGAQDACKNNCYLSVYGSYTISSFDLLYAGAAPGIVAGVTQFNIRFGGIKGAPGAFTANFVIGGSASFVQAVWVTPKTSME